MNIEMTPRLIHGRNFSFSAHSLMTLSDGAAYSVHLMNVVRNLIKFGYGKDENLLLGGFLHDTVEDTSVTIEEIKSLFGDEVADMVFRVTDEPGKNRKERKAKTYIKIRGHEKATILKLCDRIANVEYGSGEQKERYIAMYAKEQAGFEAACRVPGIADEIWDYLNSLFSDNVSK